MQRWLKILVYECFTVSLLTSKDLRSLEYSNRSLKCPTIILRSRFCEQCLKFIIFLCVSWSLRGVRQKWELKGRKRKGSGWRMPWELDRRRNGNVWKKRSLHGRNRWNAFIEALKNGMSTCLSGTGQKTIFEVFLFTQCKRGADSSAPPASHFCLLNKF